MRWGRVVAAGLALLFVIVSAATARFFVWPDLPPLPPHADAIVELGGPGNRRALSLELGREGLAPLVVISTTADQMETSWCYRGRLEGVNVHCFHPDPFTTRGEARYVAQLAREQGWRSVILVVSTDQAWRAMLRLSRCWDGEIFVAAADLRRRDWPGQIVYQWGATAKALTVERSC
jgi:uncharacterized SAM-binding protein YcdF (DUF218 family)